MLTERLFSRKFARHLHGRKYGQNVFAQKRKTHTDKSDYYGTGRAYHRFRYIFRAQVLPRVARDHLRRLCDLEYIVKAHVVQPLNDKIYIVQIVKLAVQRRRRKRNFIFVIFKAVKPVVRRFFCLIWTYSDTLAAVDALLRTYRRAALSDANSLGRAALQAVSTPFAFAFVKRHRMFIFCHVGSV